MKSDILSGFQMYIDEYIGTKSSFMRMIAQRFFDSNVRSRLYMKLATLIKNGKQLQSSIDDLRNRAVSKAATGIEAVALTEISLKMKGGNSFSSAMKNYAPMSEVMLLQAGEDSGDLPSTMELNAKLIHAAKTMRKEVIGSVVEPLVTFAMVIATLFLVGYYVVPQMAAVMPPEEWTGFAYSLHFVSTIVTSKYALIGLVFFVLVALFVLLTFPFLTGRIRAFLDRFPPWSLYRLLIGSGWLLSLAALVRSGVTLKEALAGMLRLSKTKGSSNRWLEERLTATLYHIKSGKNLGLALEDTGLSFPDVEIIDDLVTYADLPDFEKALYRLGEDWVTEGVLKVKEQATIIKGVSNLLMGIVISWLAYGVVQLQIQAGERFTSLGM